MPTDADAYQRLTRALDAHRGDADAYRRLGGQMTARRHQLGPRYGNRRLFVRERLLPLGLKETAAYKLAYDLESGKLQGRAGYSAGNMLALASAYGVTPGSVADVLGDPAAALAPVSPLETVPEGYGPAVVQGAGERLPHFADQVWTEVVAAQAAHGGPRRPAHRGAGLRGRDGRRGRLGHLRRAQPGVAGADGRPDPGDPRGGGQCKPPRRRIVTIWPQSAYRCEFA